MQEEKKGEDDAGFGATAADGGESKLVKDIMSEAKDAKGDTEPEKKVGSIGSNYSRLIAPATWPWLAHSRRGPDYPTQHTKPDLHRPPPLQDDGKGGIRLGRTKKKASASTKKSGGMSSWSQADIEQLRQAVQQLCKSTNPVS